jgi:hypothetical protein
LRVTPDAAETVAKERAPRQEEELPAPGALELFVDDVVPQIAKVEG